MSVAHRARARAPVPNWLLVYGTLITLAEVMLVVVSVPLGSLVHMAILVALAAHTAFSRAPKDPQLPVLMLLPLMRLLSLVMPIAEVDPAYWYLLSGAPALLGAALMVRAMELPWTKLGLGRPASMAISVVSAAMGIPVGLVLSGTVGPELMLQIDGAPLLVGLAVLVVVAVLEEFVFRGLLTYVTLVRAPGLVLFVPNLLYAAMYLSSGDGAVALMMGGTGILFSAFRQRSGSLYAVIVAHVLMRLVLQVEPGL